MKKKFWATFFISIICFSALFAGAGKYLSNKEPAISAGEEDGIEEAFDDEDEILVLLMGIDDNDGVGGIKAVKEKKIKGENSHKPTGMRTDTMILGKYNFKTGEITLLSIPRDTRVNIRGRKNPEKITHAHSHGGPYLSIKTVKDLLNIDLKYYMTVDYLAVKSIVDAIGGVEIDVPVKMRHPDPYIHLDPGLKTLNGDESLMYLRFRSYKEGDLGRVKAQQIFMKEFIKQVLKPKNLLALPKMVKTYYDYVDTNVPFEAVMKGAMSARKIDLENMKVATLPGEGEYIGPTSYFLYDEAEMRILVKELFGEYLLSE
ncbi:LCP family protein [Clostridium sp. Cult3]|uniref:LCP family protein n=1 Tax=Clostridium sp. Cult3 TaxID=2079004 RepID=UPI001F3BA32F|nr:LCP family protein [Clostridium sp. Cult3]MCF6460247.1 LytR family transcriptional regulator [Clostridium sp. Cult3]